jgi:anti-sigma B factor antagonist
VSNTGWTPAVPGQTSDMRDISGDGGAEPDPIILTGEDASPDQVMDVRVERHGHSVVVGVSGEIDMLTTPRLSATIDEVLRQTPLILVLDLRTVTFLGSSGLATLVSTRDEATSRGVALRLVSAEHAVLRPLTATGLTDLFEVHADLTSALLP